MTAEAPREIVWISSSLRDLRQFPDPVSKLMGFALFQAQRGGKHLQARPLRGFRGGGVLEVIEDFGGMTFRTMYTVSFEDAIYVLHSFQKKSKKGTGTPKHEMDVARFRLRIAQELHRSRKAGS